MRLGAPLILCAFIQLGLCTLPAHNVERRSSSSTEDRTVKMEVAVRNPWSLSVGQSVVINCSMSTDGDQDGAEKLTLQWVALGQTQKQVLATEPASRGISYTLGPVTLEHTGVYTCEGDKSNPNYSTKDAHKLIWVNDTSSAVSLDLIKINRVKYFYDTTYTIGCELPNDNSEWKIMSVHKETGNVIECPDQEKQGNTLSCLVPKTKGIPYWCESTTGQNSNVFDVNDIDRRRILENFVGTAINVCPTWFLKAGDSVVIECNVTVDKSNNSDKFDLQLIWSKIGPGNNMTVLLSQRASQGFTYKLDSVTHEHRGAYSCWDDGTLPQAFLFPMNNFIWVDEDSPPVTIKVLSHNRTQFFYDEEMTVGCQLPNDQGQWKIKSYDTWSGKISECHQLQLSSSHLLSCTKKIEWGNILHWCESATGETSNLLNISSTVYSLILETPLTEVMEVDHMPLRCLQRDPITKVIAPVPAVFYRSPVFIGSSEEGRITVQYMSKAKEGFYQCSTKKVISEKTWITVKARPKD